ncbi:MAG: Ppx/GppA phosphatase family protein [Candidatus Brocadiia bacterium]
MPAKSEETEEAQTAAAIDIGSNSIRMVVAQVFPDGRVDLLEETRQPVRLGQDAFVSGRLSQDTMTAAITILRDYRRILDVYGVELVRSVATSAVREASNGEAFLDRIARSVGLDVEVIEATEQSRLVVAAVRHAVGEAIPLERRVALIAEVGGGSTLLTMLRDGEIAASQSYNLGSIRLREWLSTDREPLARAADLLRQRISNSIDLARKALGLRTADTFLAIGGDARFAAAQVGDPMDSATLTQVRAGALDRLVSECALHAADELARRHRLPFADAETLVPALLVYQALLHAAQTDEMVVSQVSMRDGLLLDLPRYVSGREDPELTESILLSARNIGAKYHYDQEHAEHVSTLAVRLFDELQGEHQLTRRDRLLLRVAGLLHEVGVFVSNRAHHKHSYYLVSNAEILGLRRSEIATVAHVARYHRRAMPRPSHLDYMALPREQRMVINKLAAILRVADALDRGHYQQVQDFEMERQGFDLVIYVKGVADLALERRAMAEKADLFEDMFGMRVRLEEDIQPRPMTATRLGKA